MSRRECGVGLIEINYAYRNSILNLGYLKTIQDGHLLKAKKQHNEVRSEKKSNTKLRYSNNPMYKKVLLET